MIRSLYKVSLYNCNIFIPDVVSTTFPELKEDIYLTG